MKPYNRLIILGVSLLMATITSQQGQAQVLSVDDSAKYQSIRNKARKIYDLLEDGYYRILKPGTISESVGGAEVTFYKNSKLITRMVVKTWTEAGLMATEYYLEKEKLIYAYRTMEYFSDAPKKDSWTNFKGLGGWETRLYFSEEKLFHQRDTGTVPQASAAHFSNLPNEALKLMEQIKKH